jgi:hypothetical protein
MPPADTGAPTLVRGVHVFAQLPEHVLACALSFTLLYTVAERTGAPRIVPSGEGHPYTTAEWSPVRPTGDLVVGVWVDVVGDVVDEMDEQAPVRKARTVSEMIANENLRVLTPAAPP